MEHSKTLLEVNDLSLVYKTDYETVYAVNNVSFSLKEGEAIGIVGETGAGKTTTALAIMGLLPERVGKVTSGSIIFNGKNIITMSEPELQTVRGGMISMIFQDPMTSLNPVLRVGDQVAEAIKLHSPELSKKDIDSRVDDLFKLVGILPERKNEYPHQFSGGMKQRVVIAIALSCNPMLLIADEPTTALDVTIQAQVLAMIEELQQKQHASMIMISHDLGVIAKTCDKVCVMYAGEFVECGTIFDIFDGEKHHPYTEGLFGAIPDLEIDTPRLKAIEGLMPDPSIKAQGCPFAPRCSKCMDVCNKEKPVYFCEDGHLIKCHLFRR